jgi:ubiquinone/menaquinone biosynthesis C-methylase UbiE
LGIVGGLVFFWLFPLKLISRLAARLDKSTPCPASLAWLVDHPLRRRYTGILLDRVGIQAGETVLELGPGPGTFTVDAAHRVGSQGRLIAVDIQPRMIEMVRQRVQRAGLDNVDACVASAHALPLAGEGVDRAFLITVLPEIPDQDRALSELWRALRGAEPAEGRPGGVLSVSEEFPDPDYQFAFETIRRCEAAGFAVEQRFGNVWVYTVNFQKEERSP